LPNRRELSTDGTWLTRWFAHPGADAGELERLRWKRRLFVFFVVCLALAWPAVFIAEAAWLLVLLGVLTAFALIDVVRVDRAIRQLGE
jgi:hypothetical protein